MRTTVSTTLMTLCLLSIVGYAFKSPIQRWAGQHINNHIFENPHIIAESLKKYIDGEKQNASLKQKKTLELNRSAVFNVTSLTPIIGNPKGTQVMVVFMEPFCSHCRDFDVVLNEEVKKNKNLKIIARDIPFFGEKSEFVIKLMLAAYKQGKGPQTREMVRKLNFKLLESNMLQKFKDLKLDMNQLKKDAASPEIIDFMKNNDKLSKLINIESTPSYVIDNNFYSGGVDLETLETQLKESNAK